MLQATSKVGAVVPAGDFTPAKADFAQDAPSFSIVKIPLDSALVGQRFSLVGTALIAVAASALSANVSIAFNDQNNDAAPFSLGTGARGLRFSSIYVTATAQPGEYLTLLAVVEKADRFEWINPASQYTSVTVSKAANSTPFADVVIASGATHTFAADATRRELHLAAAAANTTICRLGGAGTGAAAGAEFAAGEKAIIGGTTSGCTAEIQVYNPGPAAATITGFTVND